MGGDDQQDFDFSEEQNKFTDFIKKFVGYNEFYSANLPNIENIFSCKNVNPSNDLLKRCNKHIIPLPGTDIHYAREDPEGDDDDSGDEPLVNSDALG